MSRQTGRMRQGWKPNTVIKPDGTRVLELVIGPLSGKPDVFIQPDGTRVLQWSTLPGQENSGKVIIEGHDLSRGLPGPSSK